MEVSQDEVELEFLVDTERSIYDDPGTARADILGVPVDRAAAAAQERHRTVDRSTRTVALFDRHAYCKACLCLYGRALMIFGAPVELGVKFIAAGRS